MILTYGCFLPGAIVPSSIVGLVERYDVGVEPTSVRTDALGPNRVHRYSPALVDRLRRASNATSLHITGEGSASVRLGAIAGFPGQTLIFETERPLDVEVIDEMSSWPGFVAALTGDGDDVFWQSADQINTYELHGRPWQHLTTVRDEIFGRVKIDISKHPGRQSPTPMMWLWAASRMWFGAGAFALIDRDRLLSLPVGKVSARPGGVVAVALFDLDDPLEVVRDRQSTFRSWLGFDEIESMGRVLVERFSDPMMTVETGSFESGGVRRVTEWRSGDRLVPQSAAAERHVVEFDASGIVVRREVLPV